MSAKILDGKKIADNILESIAAIRAENSVVPRLAILSIGADPASDVYIKNKMSACKKCGFACEIVSLPCFDEMEVTRIIEGWEDSGKVDGIIVQLPVPGVNEENRHCLRVSRQRDVDGFLSDKPKYQPCTPKGIMRMLAEVFLSQEIAGLNAVVIGRSDIVGKPVAQMLLEANCTVTVCHSHTQNLAMHTKNADILIVAAGKPGLITADMVKPGAVVIDVGINRVNGKLVGDVDFEGVKEVAGVITPVPGGVGPMTIAMLMANTVKACRQQVAKSLSSHRADKR